jgi:hypothetical protein
MSAARSSSWRRSVVAWISAAAIFGKLARVDP